MLQYRPELDGLRAVAVLSVIFFHAGFAITPGGFVGVDVFFVLSGFLITSILINEIKAGSFSFSAFYERRIRRLLPPLIPVILFTWLIAFALFETEQFADVTKSIYATLTLISNWYFFYSVDYFGGPGEFTPLLHMWSLSIEEQFYLVFPALLLLTYKFKKSALPVCGALFLASLAYASYLILSKTTDLAFYSSFGRFWELLIGSILACISKTRIKSQIATDLMELIGTAFIFAAIFLYVSSIPFPGPSALIPTIGTALVIAAAGNGRFISPILKSKPLVWVGLISYGLYLWHWPLLVLLRSVNPSPALWMTLATISATFALATASYYYLEQPIRRKRFFSSKPSIYKFGLASTATIAVAASLTSFSAFKDLQAKASNTVRTVVYETSRANALSRIEQEAKRYQTALNLNFTGDSEDFDIKTHVGYTCSFDKGNTQDRVIHCLEMQAKKTNILVMGDSVGRDTTLALRKAYPSTNFIMLHNSGCPPIEAAPKCFPDMKGTLEKLSRKVKINGIVINFRYQAYRWLGVQDSIALMKKFTNNIVIIGVSPTFIKPIDQFIKALPSADSIPNEISMFDEKMVPWNYYALAQNAQIVAQKSGIKFANTTPFFCSQKACRLWLDNDINNPIFWDRLHLTENAIIQYGKYLSKVPQIMETVRETEI